MYMNVTTNHRQMLGLYTTQLTYSIFFNADMFEDLGARTC
jgi:hypothetical protein